MIDKLKAIGGLMIIIMLIILMALIWVNEPWLIPLIKVEMSLFLILIIIGIFIAAAERIDKDE